MRRWTVFGKEIGSRLRSYVLCKVSKIYQVEKDDPTGTIVLSYHQIFTIDKANDLLSLASRDRNAPPTSRLAATFQSSERKPGPKKHHQSHHHHNKPQITNTTICLLKDKHLHALAVAAPPSRTPATSATPSTSSPALRTGASLSPSPSLL
jgi:hypothetical protein